MEENIRFIGELITPIGSIDLLLQTSDKYQALNMLIVYAQNHPMLGAKVEGVTPISHSIFEKLIGLKSMPCVYPAILHKPVGEEVEKEVEPRNTNGLTNAQTERLALLAEEAGEVVHMVGKILRHGLDSSHEDYGNVPNRELLASEVGDFYAAVGMLAKAGDLSSDKICAQSQRRGSQGSEHFHHQEVKPHKLFLAICQGGRANPEAKIGSFMKVVEAKDILEAFDKFLESMSAQGAYIPGAGKVYSDTTRMIPLDTAGDLSGILKNLERI